MGYDLYIYDENDVEISYFRSYMGGFRMVFEETGYDWFHEIDAIECDGGCSGFGIDKLIKLKDLKNAMEKLNAIPRTRYGINSEWFYRKPKLRRFMWDAIVYCVQNNKEEVLFTFF